MKYLGWLLIVVVCLQFFFIIFSQKSTFTTPYDRQYWQERFSQSQWRLPLSERTLGDDGLYLYVGDQLVQGADPSSLNAEMPPLGKYLIGLSVLLFNNGNLYGLIVNLMILIIFFFLVQSLFQKRLLSLTATAFLGLDPLFTDQSFRTMIDNIQLLALLVFFLLLTKTSASLPKKKGLLLPILLGLSLGFFSATKFPLFSPLLILLGMILFFKKGHFLQTVAFLAATFLGYLLPYFRFFWLHQNLFEWLKVQKWMLAFYRQSRLEPNVGTIFTTLFFNRYQNLFTHLRENVGSWSPSWPLVTTLGVAGLWKTFNDKQKNKPFYPALFMFIFTISLFLIYNLIPFWPRYLLLLLPFLYLGSAIFLFNLKSTWKITVMVLLILALNGLVSAQILLPTPQKTVEQFLYDWQNGFFADMYQRLDKPSQEKRSRQEFDRFGQTIFYDGEIEAASVQVVSPQWSRWQSPQVVKVSATYFTRNLGPFTEEIDLVVVKKDNQWQIAWDWDHLIGGLNEKAFLETGILEAKRGAIIGLNQERLAHDLPHHMVWVTSSQVDPNKEEAMLAFLDYLFGEKIGALGFHHRYTAKNPDQPIPLGTPPSLLGHEIKKKLEEFSGISLTPKMGRIYRTAPVPKTGQVANTHYFECCSQLYSTTTYDGVSGVEKEKNEILKGYNGGYLVIKNQKGEIIRTIIEKEKKDGQDVQL